MQSSSNRSANPAGHSHGTPRPGRGRHTVLSTAIAVLCLALSACAVRLETPPPSEPTPDALEVSRRAAVADVQAINEVAASTLKETKRKSPRAKVLANIVAASERHLDQLGGKYVSGLDPQPEVSPGAGPEVDPGPPADPAVVIDRLDRAYSRTRGSLESIPDAGLARLVAAIATSQLTSARALASTTELDLPAVPAEGTPRFPATQPRGLPVGALLPVILSEDRAGYAYEVLAARLLDAPRVAAQARAAVHRDRAEAAASAAQVARTAKDPRRVAYDLPDSFRKSTPAESFAAEMELGLAQSYASLIGLVAEEERVTYFDLLVDSYHSALTWGADPVMFPGLPEQQG